MVKHPSSSVGMGSKRHVVDLDLRINEDISEKYVGVKEFKGSLDTPYVPAVSPSGDDLSPQQLLGWPD